MPAHRRRRVPQLRFTENRNVGWHVSYRDPNTGVPRKHRFGMIDEEQARIEYHRWLVDHLGGGSGEAQAAEENTAEKSRAKSTQRAANPDALARAGSILDVASSLLRLEKARTRQPDSPKTRGTISPDVLIDRNRHIKDFLAYINKCHGEGACGRMVIGDLTMQDVEGYNRHIVAEGYSESQVRKRMRIIKVLVNRAGRPEFGAQMLAWNWDSRDVVHGKPTESKSLPNVSQLRSMLEHCDLRERTLIWMGIGLGFGQTDLSVVRVGQINEKNYDLRRSKTGIERYGETPALVWAHIKAHVQESPRESRQLLFTTRTGKPLVHGTTDSLQQWWSKLRLKIGEDRSTLSGFYILRHLGATVYGSNPGCSVAAMRRWLGHAASSSMADIYMRPVPPEDRDVTEWVRSCLPSSELDCWR